MRSTHPLVLLSLLLCTTLAAAVAVPRPGPRNSDTSTLRNLVASQHSGHYPKVLPRQSTATGSTPEEVLASSINDAGIAFQGQMATLQSLANLQAANSTSNNFDAFNATKDNLLGFMTMAARARTNSLKLVPDGNPVVTGLEKLMEQQIMQLTLVNKLTGNSTDATIISQLQQETQSLMSTSQALAQQVRLCLHSVTQVVGSQMF